MYIHISLYRYLKIFNITEFAVKPWIEDHLVSSLTNHLFQQRNFAAKVWLVSIFDLI